MRNTDKDPRQFAITSFSTVSLIMSSTIFCIWSIVSLSVSVLNQSKTIFSPLLVIAFISYLIHTWLVYFRYWSHCTQWASWYLSRKTLRVVRIFTNVRRYQLCIFLWFSNSLIFPSLETSFNGKFVGFWKIKTSNDIILFSILQVALYFWLEI